MFFQNIKYSILIVILNFTVQTIQCQTIFRGKITDAITEMPLAGVKVGISDQGIGVVTNENGNFNYRKYHQTLSNTSVLQISAPGYTTIEINQWDIRELFNKSSKIVMSPIAEEAAVIAPKGEQKVTVFWDVSVSAARRDFNKEWGFLEAYLEQQGDVSVDFVVFSDKVKWRETILAKASLENLKGKIENLSYSGATDYSVIDIEDSDAVLLFSDGGTVLGELQAERDTPVYAITSVLDAEHEYLKKVAVFTSGSYVYLPSVTYAQGLEQILSGSRYQEDALNSISKLKGTIVNGDTPVQGARIYIKGDLEEFISEADGSFAIPAMVGDVIRIRHFGMYDREMLVTDLSPMRVTLKTLDELLGEVVIKGKKRLKDENKANTGFGDKSKDAVGVSVNTILGSELGNDSQSIADAIRGRFAGVRVSGFGQNAEILIRENNGSQPPIWVVDSAIFMEVPGFVDVQSIASISILKSIIATSRYGNIASGGAIIINTRNYQIKELGGVVDQALLKNNDYSENLDALNLDQLEPDYIKQLKSLPSIEEQYKRYEHLAKGNASNASFFIDMALYFQTVDKEKAALIRSNLVEMAHKNGQVLRTVAYLYDAVQDTKTSLKLYEHIVKLLPREAQSYRDLAKAYKGAGSYDRSLELYINMLGEQILGVNFKDIDILLSHELLNLTSRFGDQLNMTRLPEDYKGFGFELDLKMTLEYSNRTAPFEFQFVSPADKFYKFNHTLLDNRDRLEAEEKSGFQIEEFVVDDAEHGLWKVNLEYLGDKTSEVLPNYIKYTVYWDYGTASQRQEVIVLKLTPDIKKGQFYEFLL